MFRKVVDYFCLPQQVTGKFVQQSSHTLKNFPTLTRSSVADLQGLGLKRFGCGKWQKLHLKPRKRKANQTQLCQGTSLESFDLQTKFTHFSPIDMSCLIQIYSAYYCAFMFFSINTHTPLVHHPWSLRSIHRCHNASIFVLSVLGLCLSLCLCLYVCVCVAGGCVV